MLGITVEGEEHEDPKYWLRAVMKLPIISFVNGLLFVLGDKMWYDKVCKTVILRKA